MQIFHNLDEWRCFRRALPIDKSLGFVPTLGNLHHAHATLFSTSLQENDRSAVSIFVNPTQFNQSSDFKHYPRTLDADLEMLRNLGVDYCLLPDEKAIYNDGFHFQIHENNYSQIMEGKQRPGHFIGVLTIVMKLLNLVKPKRVYFGEKDYQQYKLIHDMAAAFFMDIEVKPCPTIYESNELAYSSRNNRLTKEQRNIAEQFAQLFHQNLPDDQLKAELNKLDLELEYIQEYEARRYIAVNIGGIRLIDNYSIDKSFT